MNEIIEIIDVTPQEPEFYPLGNAQQDRLKRIRAKEARMEARRRRDRRERAIMALMYSILGGAAWVGILVTISLWRMP